MNKYLVGGLSLVAIVLGLAGFYSLSSRVDDLSLSIQNLPALFGAASGQTHSNPEQFLDQIFVSRVGSLNASLPGVSTSTVPASPTGTTAGQFSWKAICENSVIDVNLLASATLTFPSSTSMFNNCLKKVGDYRDFVVANMATGTNIMFSVSDQSSTLMLSVTSSSGEKATSSINAKSIANFRALRLASTTYSPTGTILVTSPWLFWMVNVFK